MFRVQGRRRQGGGDRRCVVCRIFGGHFQFAVSAGPGVRESVNGKTQPGQDLVVHNVVIENRVRIERVFRQYDAVAEFVVVADGPVLPEPENTLDAFPGARCEAAHTPNNG